MIPFLHRSFPTRTSHIALSVASIKPLNDQVFLIIKGLYESGWGMWYDEGLGLGSEYYTALENRILRPHKPSGDHASGKSDQDLCECV